MVWLYLMMVVCQPQPVADGEGVFSKALWFVQAYGNPTCSWAEHDQHVKHVLAKSLADDRQLSLAELSELVDIDVFQQFAGEDSILSDAELTAALATATPAARLRLFPKLKLHADELTTSFDMIAPSKYRAIDQLSDWIVQQSETGEPLNIVTTCTGNSRRSILSAQMGNLAAAFYGFENVRFYSGGTAPTAFDPRTITTLQEIGFHIEPTGKEAERGEIQLSNPIFDIAWGEGLSGLEFSKMFDHKSNPQAGFAAILVCSEADDDCPHIAGAAYRISMTFLDPKAFDDSRFETQKYAERRDDIGRTFLAVMANARRKLHHKTASNEQLVRPRDLTPQGRIK
jgi:arsenate reductase (thioredoxin)